VAGLLRRLGGIPVRRDRRDGLVTQVVAAFAGAEALVVGMTSEGARFRTPLWKSGFYHIARGARVPIVPAAIDRDARPISPGSLLEPSGNPRRDREPHRSFYADARDIHPERVGPVGLREEAGLPSPVAMARQQAPP
jgi:hypothetical protein